MKIDNINSIFQNRRGKPLGVTSNYGVLLPLIYVNDELHILYQIRAKTLDTQPGEISFPGGKVENSESFKDASIRETCEELNINIENINLIGEIDYIVMPFNISIYPYVAYLNNIDINNLNYNKDEVESIFTVPISYFIENEPLKHNLYIDPKPDETFPYDLVQNGKAYNWRTGKYPVYFYNYKGNIIWGITARITKNFIDIIKKTS